MGIDLVKSAKYIMTFITLLEAILDIVPQENYSTSRLFDTRT